jgi:hypothetical protein
MPHSKVIHLGASAFAPDGIIYAAIMPEKRPKNNGQTVGCV